MPRMLIVARARHAWPPRLYPLSMARRLPLRRHKARAPSAADQRSWIGISEHCLRFRSGGKGVSAP